MKEFEGKAHYPLDLDGLPSGWASAFVGDVCSDVQSGFASGEHNAQGNGVPHIRPMNIDREGRLVMDTTKYVNGDVDERRLRRGDVLFNNTNSPVLVGKTTAVSSDAELAFSNHMTRLRPMSEVDYRFLAHQLHFFWMCGYFARRCNNHVNQASVSADTLSTSVPVSIAPSDEQRRVVDAIESYLSRLDAAVANLDSAQKKLKAYRASVLKAAVEGRLVPTEGAIARAEKRDFEPADALLKRILAERRRRWEDAELAKLKAAGKLPKDDKWKAKYQEPEAPDTKDLPELPEGWCWATLDQLCHLLRNGQSSAPREERGVRTLRISAVRPLSVDFQDVRFLPGRPEDYPNDLIEEGDLLFTRYNGTPSLVGVCARVRSLTEPTVHPDKLIKVRLVSGLHGPYVEVAANAGESRRLIEQRTRTTAGQAGVSGSDLKQMPIPVPPLPEQVRIADEVERLLSVADETRATVASDGRRCARLRQAVLKWAFEGKLVDQDPNDEPAEKLLDRIRADRAEADTPKRTRRARNGQ